MRFVYLASDVSQHRFKELSTIDPSFPDVTIASPNANIHTVVAEVLSSISSSKLIYKWLQKKQDRQCTYVGKSVSKLQIHVATYVFELSAGNCHR